jgi:hypothetical protein
MSIAAENLPLPRCYGHLRHFTSFFLIFIFMMIDCTSENKKQRLQRQHCRVETKYICLLLSCLNFSYFLIPELGSFSARMKNLERRWNLIPHFFLVCYMINIIRFQHSSIAKIFSFYFSFAWLLFFCLLHSQPI